VLAHTSAVNIASDLFMNEQMKEAEKRLTKELANQAHAEPGSAEEEEAKEKRAQAEKDMNGDQPPASP
jgi:uncharacterized protein YdaU (DUF1376 family)